MLIFDKHFIPAIVMMKQKEVFNKIGGIIKELNDQYEYLQSNPESLNDLELELFVANTHFLADHAEVLRKLNMQSSVTKTAEEKTASDKETFFEPVIRKVEPDPKSKIELEPEIIKHELEIDESWIDDEELSEDINIEDELPDDELTIEEQGEEEELIDESIDDELRIHDDIDILSDTLPIEEPKPVEPPAKPVDEVFTINQKISAQMGSKPESALQPISDLKPAITLNDKLLFVKDLFNGYSLAYSEAIEILNRFKSFDEADTFLKKNYVVKNNWDAKPETTAKFYELLKRRYL